MDNLCNKPKIARSSKTQDVQSNTQDVQSNTQIIGSAPDFDLIPNFEESFDREINSGFLSLKKVFSNSSSVIEKADLKFKTPKFSDIFANPLYTFSPKKEISKERATFLDSKKKFMDGIFDLIRFKANTENFKE